MLRANVGLSRKVSRDYQSTGYTVNIEGEIATTVDEPETILGRVQELFSLANEALQVEIDRDQGEQAIGRRDVEPPVPQPQPSQPRPNGKPAPTRPLQRSDPPAQSNSSGQNEPITNKQAQFLHNLAKRNNLSTTDLEAEIERITGRRARVFDLSKREAGKVLDAMTKAQQGNGHSANQPA